MQLPRILHVACVLQALLLAACGGGGNPGAQPPPPPPPQWQAITNPNPGFGSGTFPSTAQSAGSVETLWQWSDATATWTAAPPFPWAIPPLSGPDFLTLSLVVNPANTSEIFISFDQRVFESHDAGTSWTDITSGLPSSSPGYWSLPNRSKSTLRSNVSKCQRQFPVFRNRLGSLAVPARTSV